MSPLAVVVGSANMDLVYRVGHLPAPGETILAVGSSRQPGGKGNNQAIAAARAGVLTAFVAAVGSDPHGDELMALLDATGVVECVRRSAAPTGTALIVVDQTAENTIVVDAGANSDLRALTPEDKALVAAAQVVLLQLEVPDSVVLETAELARHSETKVVLNAAPFRPLPAELLGFVDVLIVNEGEAQALGMAEVDRVPTRIVTLGAAGAEVITKGTDPVLIPAPVVTAIDTTGAGDTFCGSFVAALCEGRSLVAAAQFAVAASAIAVQRHGATTSIPHRAEIEAALAAP